LKGSASAVRKNRPYSLSKLWNAKASSPTNTGPPTGQHWPGTGVVRITSTFSPASRRWCTAVLLVPAKNRISVPRTANSVMLSRPPSYAQTTLPAGSILVSLPARVLK
jgi:hypothetical protein